MVIIIYYALDSYSRNRYLRLVRHCYYTDNKRVSGYFPDTSTFFVVSILASLSTTNAYAQLGSGQYVTQILNILSVLERMFD